MGRDLLLVTEDMSLEDPFVSGGRLKLRLVQATDDQSQLKVLHLLYTNLLV